MTRESILAVLRANKSLLEKEMGVKTIALFGSYARGEQSPGSYLDILVEMEQADFQRYSLLQSFLEQHFAVTIDLLRKGPHLRKKFLEAIESELVYA